MELDLGPLRNTIQRLDEGIVRAGKSPDDAGLRDSVIKRFEFTYELAYKMLRRYLTVSEPDPEVVAEMTFPEMIRTANQRNLLRSDWPMWHKYRELQNRTAHAYDEQKAIEVSAAIPDFLAEAQFLLHAMEQRVQRS